MLSNDISSLSNQFLYCLHAVIYHIRKGKEILNVLSTGMEKLLRLNVDTRSSSWEIDSANRFLILDEAFCVSLRAHALRKCMNPSLLPLAIDKFKGRLGSLALERQPNFEKENWIQTSSTSFKNWPYVSFCPWWKSWINAYTAEADAIIVGSILTGCHIV